jgi:hypothetical protein
MSAPAQTPPDQNEQNKETTTGPACSFNWEQFTPWDPCWQRYKDSMVPTACGRPICKHHWLSHVMMECLACNRQQLPAINAEVDKAIAAQEERASKKK